MFSSTYSRSVVMVILGGICLSLLGIGDRSVEAATGPQIVFYRGVGQTVFFTFAFLILRKAPLVEDFKSLTWRGWVTAGLTGLAGFLLVMSFQYTEVANAIFIVSLTPLIAALLAWLFLKEAINRRTTFALVLALIGVSIIFGTNMNGKGVIGMGLALLMTISYASAIVMMRLIPKANVILMCAAGGVFTMLLMLPALESFTLSRHDLMICLGLGVVQVGLGSALVLSGARHVPAAQVSILALVEVVLSPIWVWAFAEETPSATTLIGGAIVLVGVIYQALSARDEIKTS